MEKTVWVVEADRKNMLDMQRKICALGGIRVICVYSEVMMQKVMDKCLNQDDSLNPPSLIIINYEMTKQYPDILESLRRNSHVAGIPLFFTVEAGEDINKEEYYLQGAMVVFEKPVDQKMLFRIQQAVGQYELTKSYERILQKQISELAAAKEIQQLNIQLEHRNQFLHKVFGRYFSDEVLEMIMEKREGEFIGGSRVPMAVLMADLRGFSSKSEQMGLQTLMELLNNFFGTMAEIITQHDGTIIELMGDGILAVFGALIKNEQYAEAAIASAIKMQNEMKHIQEFCAEHSIPQVEMGIGVHCGTAFVGNVGSERMMRYNVIGRVVNECSRMESCSVGGQVLISKETLQKLSCHAEIESTAAVEAKGMKEPLQIYEISGLDGTYACHLEKKQTEPLQYMKQTVFFELFQIISKMISERKTIGRVLALNAQEAVLEMVEEKENAAWEELAVFSDVEVRLKDRTGSYVFSGVYAKVMEIKKHQIRLHFTHSNRELETFFKDIKGALE